MEYVIAFMLAIGIILLCFRMVCSLQNIPHLNTYPNYDDLLEVCFNLIIGVELIRMMYSHSPSTVFEVLLFCNCETYYHGSLFYLQQSDRGMLDSSLIRQQGNTCSQNSMLQMKLYFGPTTKAKVVQIKLLSVNIPQ